MGSEKSDLCSITETLLASWWRESDVFLFSSTIVFRTEWIADKVGWSTESWDMAIEQLPGKLDQINCGKIV